MSSDQVFRAEGLDGQPKLVRRSAVAEAIDEVCGAVEAPIVKGSLVYEIDNLICAAAAIQLPGLATLEWGQLWGWLARLPVIEQRIEQRDDLPMMVIADIWGDERRAVCHEEHIIRWLASRLDSPTVAAALRAYSIWLWPHVKEVAGVLRIRATKTGLMTRRNAAHSAVVPHDLALLQHLMAVDVAVG